MQISMRSYDGKLSSVRGVDWTNSTGPTDRRIWIDGESRYPDCILPGNAATSSPRHDDDSDRSGEHQPTRRAFLHELTSVRPTDLTSPLMKPNRDFYLLPKYFVTDSVTKRPIAE